MEAVNADSRPCISTEEIYNTIKHITIENAASLHKLRTAFLKFTTLVHTLATSIV